MRWLVRRLATISDWWCSGYRRGRARSGWSWCVGGLWRVEGGFRLRGVARGGLLTSGYRRGTRSSWCVGGL